MQPSNPRPLAHFRAPLLALPALLGAILPAGANQTEAPPDSNGITHHVYEARPLTAGVKVDGILNEKDWQTPGNDGLIQIEPSNGVPPVQKTRWWIAYDHDAIYAAFRLYDTAPESIDTAVARRDDYSPTDAVALEFDTYNDDRNGYFFLVGAGGLVYDAVLSNDGYDDPSWDAVWDCATKVDSLGWTCEMRIPFSQLRFPNREEQVWGVNVSRRYKRNGGRDDLFLRRRTESGHNSRFPDLIGIRGITDSADRELLLYGTAKGEYLQHSMGDPFNDGSRYDYAAGGDLKWGLTSNLTLNATVNPDFGQVEVDPAVVNISDSETYYDEKRPFFVQDANVFNFGSEGTNNNWNFNWLDPILFYSRRIGRAPQLDVARSYDYQEPVSASTILGAAKATGKLGPYQVGVLGALTDKEDYTLSSGGHTWTQLAEPMSGYGLVRVNREAPNGRHAFGAILTGVHRDLSTDLARESVNRNAYTGGVDGWVHFGNKDTWAVRGYMTGSLIQGSAEDIAAQQTSSVHYYQRPDQTHARFDPNRTSLSGWASRVLLNKERGDITLNTGLGASSPGYEINDLGYRNRADQVNYHLAVGHRWTEPTKHFRNRSATLATYWTWDFGGTRNGGGAGLWWDGTFSNYWNANGEFFYNPPYYSTTATRGGPKVRIPVHKEFNVYLNSDSRKSYQGTAYFGAGRNNAGEWNDFTGVDLSLQPTGALKITMGPGFSREVDKAQYVTTVDDPAAATYGHRYVFSALDYKELSMGMRVNWAFTPRLTLQSYFQPLIAVGKYSHFQEYAEAGTFDFNAYGEDGSSIGYDPASDEYTVVPGHGGDPFSIANPNFNYKSLRVNLVLRWEYRPGSTFYLVWTRNGVDQNHPGEFDFHRDVSSLFSARSDNVVAMKLTRWLDF